MGTRSNASFGASLFIDADKAGRLLLADVTGHPVVSHYWHLDAVLDERRDLFGDQVVVQDVRLRRAEAAQDCDLVGIAACCVDHMLALDRALLGHDLPVTGRQQVHFDHSVAARDRGPKATSMVGKRHGHARRIDMALALGPDRGLNVGHVVERAVLLGFVGSDELNGVADIATNTQVGLQVVELFVGIGQSQAARLMERDALVGDLFEFFIERDRIVVERGGGVVADRAGDLTCGMPGGSRGQLGLLYQHDIGPTRSRQVPERRCAVYAAADDDYPGTCCNHSF